MSYIRENWESFIHILGYTCDICGGLLIANRYLKVPIYKIPLFLTWSLLPSKETAIRRFHVLNEERVVLALRGILFLCVGFLLHIIVPLSNMTVSSFGLMQEETSPIQEEIKGVEKHLIGKIETLDGWAARLSGKIDTLTGRVGAVEEFVSAIERRMSSVEARMGTLEEKLDTLNLKAEIFHVDQQRANANKEIINAVRAIAETNYKETTKRIGEIEVHLNLPPLK